MVRGRKGENASKRKGHALLWLRMIICPPIRTVCESREILLLPCTCVHARLLLAVVCVAPIEDNNRPICSIRHFSSSSFSFFFFFFFFGGGGAQVRWGFLKPFEFMTRKNSIGIVPTDPPFLLSLESRAYYYLYYSILCSFIEFCGLLSLRLSSLRSPASIDRSIDGICKIIK